MIRPRACSILVSLALAAVSSAQVALPPGFAPRPSQPAPQAPPPPQQTEQAKPAAQTPESKPQPSSPQTGSQPVVGGPLMLQNASLSEVIDILARQLKIAYILDPRLAKGGVILNTYGEMKSMNTRSLLEMILRMNGAGMVQVGDVYRIVPLTDISRLPLSPQVNPSSIPEDDRTTLNLIFLKYAAADELSKLLEPFLGESAKMYTYSSANLLLILDSNRSMKRTMELVALFDNDMFTSQKVKLFDVKNARPSDLAKEIENVFKSMSLSEKNAPIKFIGLNRINTLLVVAANSSVFPEVEKWLKKLDVQEKVTAGSVDNYVYRVRYGDAGMLAMAIMSLYGGGGMYGMGMYGGMGGMYGASGMYGGGMYGSGGMYGGSGMLGGGMYGGGMYGGGMYGGGYGGAMYGGGMYGGGYGGYGPLRGPSYAAGVPAATANGSTPTGTTGTGTTPATGTDLTGSYLGSATQGAMSRMPRIIPNPMDNSLLIQAAPQEYESITKLLRQLDVPPRQVLIDAKIYELTLSGAFSSGVAAYLATKSGDSAGGTSAGIPTRKPLASLSGAATNFSAGTLVGQSRELLAFLQLQETAKRAKVVSAPSVIATDSIPASINVGTEVPTLTSTAATGAISGGNTQFAQTIQSRNSGVSLSIVARVTPSGIVTMVINQEVSTPIPPDPGGIQSPSFSKRTIQTQVTVEDGDTIAIAGIINENNTYSTGGIPVLNRIPIAGGLFGSRSYSKDRTELIIFMTPRVIYDTNQIAEATDELKSRLRKLQKIVQE